MSTLRWTSFTLVRHQFVNTFIHVDRTGRFEAKHSCLVGCVSLCLCEPIHSFHDMWHSKLPVAWWVYRRPAHLSYMLMHHGCSTGLEGRIGADWGSAGSTLTVHKEKHIWHFLSNVQYWTGILFLAQFKKPLEHYSPAFKLRIITSC